MNCSFPPNNDDEYNKFIEFFELAKVSRPTWTHRAHLFVGIWYAHHLPEAEAMNTLRTKITALNTANGVPNSDTDGYHETITRLWLKLICAELAKMEDKSNLTKVAESIADKFASGKEIVGKYYSKQIIDSPEARKSWVEPDLNLIEVSKG